jgi:lambda family phage portal protein
MALGMKKLGHGLASTFERGAMALGGFTTGRGGHESGRRDTRRTRGWRPGQGSAAADDLPDLPELRGRSRDLDRNNPLAHGAIQTKANGVVGAGLQLRSVIDADVLGITDPQRIQQLQYTIEREWDLFSREADFSGQMHLMDLQRLIYWSGTISGDIGIARRYRKRPGETYGTRIVAIEADRICNPNRRADSDLIQAGVQLSADGEVLGYHVTDRHPGDMRGSALSWRYVPRRGPSGMLQFILAVRATRPGQVRGLPLFSPIEETLKQLGDYTAAEIKAAINDAYLFATEETPTEIDDEGNPIVTRPDGQADDAGELTLEDLTITTLPPGSKLNVKAPARPNTAFDGFVASFCKYIGASLGLPYEVLLMHFAASFSASRGALEVAYKGFLIERDWFIRTVLDTVREWQFTEMVAGGRFDAPGFFDDPIKRLAWLGREWIGPTRVQINPQVEAKADETDIILGVKTREQVMTERTGGSFDTKSKQVLREREVLGVPAAPGSSSRRALARNNDGTDEQEDRDDE